MTNYSWSGVIDPGNAIAGSTTAVLLGSLALENQGIDETAFRVVGNIMVVSDQAAAIETQIGSVGLIVVTDLAIAAGAASIPGPSTNVEDDQWFCHQLFANKNQVAADPRPAFFDFSSKGRRVVQDGEAIALMCENSSGACGFSIAVQFRMLSRITGI